MPLSNAQKTALKTAILAEPAVAAFLAVGDDGSIAAYYNTAASPVVKAWRESFSAQELFDSMNITKYDNLSVGKRDAYRLMMDMGGVDPTKNRIRKAITDIWGADAAPILTDMTENATRAEVLFGGTNDTESGVTALKRAWIGQLSPGEVGLALRG